MAAAAATGMGTAERSALRHHPDTIAKDPLAPPSDTNVVFRAALYNLESDVIYAKYIATLLTGAMLIGIALIYTLNRVVYVDDRMPAFPCGATTATGQHEEGALWIPAGGSAYVPAANATGPGTQPGAHYTTTITSLSLVIGLCAGLSIAGGILTLLLMVKLSSGLWYLLARVIDTAALATSIVALVAVALARIFACNSSVVPSSLCMEPHSYYCAYGLPSYAAPSEGGAELGRCHTCFGPALGSAPGDVSAMQVPRAINAALYIFVVYIVVAYLAGGNRDDARASRKALVTKTRPVKVRIVRLRRRIYNSVRGGALALSVRALVVVLFWLMAVNRPGAGLLGAALGSFNWVTLGVLTAVRLAALVVGLLALQQPFRAGWQRTWQIVTQAALAVDIVGMGWALVQFFGCVGDATWGLCYDAGAPGQPAAYVWILVMSLAFVLLDIIEITIPRRIRKASDGARIITGGRMKRYSAAAQRRPPPPPPPPLPAPAPAPAP